MHSIKEDDSEFIRMDFNNSNIKNLNIFVRENTSIQKEKKIGDYLIGDVKHSILSPIFGKIVKIDIDDKCIIMQKCLHESIYRKLCTDCGFDTRY
jgi:hypothetical protein